MMSDPDKLQEKGQKMVDVGHKITGFVWSVFFLVVIAFLLWHVASS